MKLKTIFILAIVLVAGGALALRLVERDTKTSPLDWNELDLKPFHGDEAVQAYKFGGLLDEGFYEYDPVEYHGPTLYYLTLPVAWLTSDGTFAGTSDFTYRIVPVAFGVGLILLLLLLGDAMGRFEAVCAGVLTAVSPAMVYFSRYYIQEMLLVFFTLLAIAAGRRYVGTRRLGWMLLLGAALGLMHATKETCVIAYAAMAGALGIVMLDAIVTRGPDDLSPSMRSYFKGRHIAAGIAVGAVVSVVFFSSFFTNASGPLDSILTYKTYLDRSGGAGMHESPPLYYLKMLAFHQKSGRAPWFSEGVILGLAAVGFVAAIVRRGVTDGTARFARFIAIYTVVMTAAYSAIAYKTPWCMLGFLHGMILLAGIGAAVIVRLVPTKPLKGVAVLLLAAGAVHLGTQASALIGRKFCVSEYNPYVYGHSVNGVVRMAERIEELAGLYDPGEDAPPEAREMPVLVIAPGADDPSLQDSWPLPYYLRRMKRVGYYTELPENLNAPVIVASPAVRDELDARLCEMYGIKDVSEKFIFSYKGLRPGVNLLLYVRKDLWDVFIEKIATRRKPGK